MVSSGPPCLLHTDGDRWRGEHETRPWGGWEGEWVGGRREGEVEGLKT